MYNEENDFIMDDAVVFSAASLLKMPILPTQQKMKEPI